MYTVFFFYLWGSLRIWSKYNYFHFVTYTHIHTKTTTYTNIDINKRKKPIEKKTPLPPFIGTSSIAPPSTFEVLLNYTQSIIFSIPSTFLSLAPHLLYGLICNTWVCGCSWRLRRVSTFSGGKRSACCSMNLSTKSSASIRVKVRECICCKPRTQTWMNG